MIFEALGVAIVLLIIANVAINLKRRKQTKKPFYFNANYSATTAGTEVEVIQEPREFTKETQSFSQETKTNYLSPQIRSEKEYLLHGAVSAANQKLVILNDRITNVEKAVSSLIEEKINSPKQIEKESDFDYEKFDFRIKVLEQELDEIKNPSPVQKTFYGKTDDEMEDRIKSLAFNSKKKTS